MKKCLSAGAALALMLVAAACGSDSSGDNASTTGSVGTSEPISELRWGSTPVTRADYQTAFSIQTGTLVAPVAQGLMTYGESGRLEKALAETAEQRDDVTYVYTLKDGVKFSDGKPLTVADAVWSLNRNFAKDAQTGPNFTNVKSIRAEGDEIVFTLKRPDVTFVNVPAFSGQIIEKAAAEKGGVDKLGTPANLPVGTGPYRFTSFSSEVGAKYELNPYWSGPRPTVQRINMKFVKDSSALALALRSGEIDGSFLIDDARSFQFPGVKIIPGVGGSMTVLSMNTIAPPFDDIHVRRAIAYATNREGMLRAVFGGAGEVAETLSPPSVMANVAPADEVQAAFGALPRYDYDLEAARAELAKSRYPNGFTTTLPAEPQGVRIGAALAPDLAKIGIKLKVDEVTVAEWLAILQGPRDKLGLFYAPYGSTYPDPSSLMNYWLSPEQAKVKGLNSANWRNAEVGRLLGEQNQESDGAKRLELITDIYALMKRDVPYVPVVVPARNMVLSSKLTIDGYSAWTANASPWPLRVRKAS